MSARRGAQRRAAFTLLEAVIALAILSAVMIAVLQVRAQSIVARTQLAGRLAAERNADTLFQMVLAGAIEPPTTDPDSPVVTWAGDYLGAPYEIRRSPSIRANPSREAVPYEVAPVVLVYEYEITYEGRTTTFTWHH